MLPWMLTALAAAKPVAQAEQPPDPELNASAEITTSSTTTHNITLALGPGTSRLVLITGAFQSSGLDFTSAVFDQGGGDQAAMTPVAQAQNTSGPNTATMYYYDVPDGVAAGNKTIRIVSDISGNADVFAAAYNNIAAGGPTDTEIAETDFDPNPITTTVTVSNTNDLVVSVLGTDQASTAFTPSGVATRHARAGGTGGASSMFGDNLTTAPGALNVTWSRNAGAAAAVDGAIVTAVFPHL